MASSSAKMTLHILIDEYSGYYIIQIVRMLADWLQILARFS